MATKKKKKTTKTKARTSKKKVPRRRAAAEGPKTDQVFLNTEEGESFVLDYSGGAPAKGDKETRKNVRRRKFQQLAMNWAYNARNRSRWARTPHARKQMAERVLEQIKPFGVDEAGLVEAMRRVVRSNMTEVSVPYVSEGLGWEARILPWEYALSAVAEALDHRWSTTIVRHLHRARRARAHPRQPRVLMVASCPGRLAEYRRAEAGWGEEGAALRRFSFDTEWDVVRTSLGTPLPTTGGPEGAHQLNSPTLARLQAWIHENSPDVIHLAGVDSHEGAGLLARLERRQRTRPGTAATESPEQGDESATPRRLDGFYLADERGEAVPVEAQSLAAALNAGKDHPPSLVVFNTAYSASRLAAVAVGEGAGCAIGFQDVIDSALAETFIGDVYRGWSLSDGDIWSAFQVAWRKLRCQPKTMRGSGVVLWNETSLRDEPARDRRLEESLDAERREPYVLVEGTALRDVLKVDVALPRRLNYSLLHNDSDLFPSFRLRKTVHRMIRDVQVDVALQVGSDRFGYRAMFDIDHNPTVIEDRIRLPLTWSYVRDLKESVRSTLFVQVGRQGDLVHQQTYPLDIRPVEEWEDTEEDRVWLPSFILPRDPGVERVIHEAQRFLCALVDDRGAGFDGYQSVDPEADDPGEPVDLQVRAIWTALLERGLGYINPPPAYSYTAQRLRKPSSVLDAGHGTCIDLTLLLAACLEYVEIYPAIFLLKGHAFPGYWRTGAAYDSFRELAHMEGAFEIVDEDMDPDSLADNVIRRQPWMIAGPESHAAILNAVRSDELVPLEGVALTYQAGFLEAVAQGLENLEPEDEFDFLIDVPLARLEYGITPLPL